MSEVTILQGLPASGKTTWAKERQAYDSNILRLNKDDMREQLFNGKWSKQHEKFVLKARDVLIAMAVAGGYDVIVDDTNLHNKHLETIQQLLKGTGHRITTKFFEADVDECIARDLKRPRSVGAKVIQGMYNQFLKLAPQPIVFNPSLPTAVICDLDGTLALHNGRSPFDWVRVGEDSCNYSVANFLASYIEYKEVILVSGRDGICRPETVKWLEKHEIDYGMLFMRQPNDNRDDRIVKREIYDEHIRGKYNVELVIDDRAKVVRMWRDLGLQCWQVAEGDF